MEETTKSKKLWGDLERSIIKGKGIDIGCGPDPVDESARGFDMNDGDANEISKYVHEQFDYVYSSHCLEHMHDPRKTLLDWWRLVRPGGHLFFVVPDEDLYEQGRFPSRFNTDHKATFTLSKDQSWSPVSINVLDLANSLPDAQIVKLVLQDQGYDRSLMRHDTYVPGRAVFFLMRVYYQMLKRDWPGVALLGKTLSRFVSIDQTRKNDATAQLQCIIKKRQDHE